jgi:hypothetical protein
MVLQMTITVVLPMQRRNHRLLQSYHALHRVPHAQRNLDDPNQSHLGTASLQAVGFFLAQQQSQEAQRLATSWAIILEIRRAAQRKPKAAMVLAHTIKELRSI